MPKLKRTPPSSVSKKVLEHGLSQSDSDIPAAAENMSGITPRYKRPRTTGSHPREDIDDDSLETFKKDLMEMLEVWKAEQNKTLSKLVTDVAQLKTQCTSIQKSNSDIETAIISLNKDYEDVMIKVTKLEKEHEVRQLCIEKIEKQVQEIALKTRSSSIEIRNVPSQPDENVEGLLKIVSQLGDVTKTDIQSSDIRDVRRLPGKPGSSRSILVEFSSVLKKNNVLTAVRTFNKELRVEDKLNTKTIGLAGEKKPIYVDEHLSAQQRRLHYLARDFAKGNNYKYCWISNNKIFIRKNSETKEVHVINSEQCLAKLKETEK